MRETARREAEESRSAASIFSVKMSLSESKVKGGRWAGVTQSERRRERGARAVGLRRGSERRGHLPAPAASGWREAGSWRRATPPALGLIPAEAEASVRRTRGGGPAQSWTRTGRRDTEGDETRSGAGRTECWSLTRWLLQTPAPDPAPHASLAPPSSLRTCHPPGPPRKAHPSGPSPSRTCPTSKTGDGVIIPSS